MRIKKFDCHQCGAPKVTAYKNPYIVCDYCGYMIDVDYSVGLEVWNHSEEHTFEYLQKKAIFESDSAKYLNNKDKAAYWKTNFDFWDFYYKHFPEYLPPTVSKGKKYDAFIKAAADMAADTINSDISPAKYDAYMDATKSLFYYQKDGQNFVDYAAFLKMIHTYLEVQTQGFRIVYDNPEYEIMNEVMPEKFQLKMKLSQIAQVWIPYLEDFNADAFLNEFHLKQEYVEMEDPILKQYNCEDCKEELSIPDGALKCICMKCRHENILKKAVHCHDCGYENELPANWDKMISCKSCGTQLRVVQPLFG
jgi:hypothetical protein